MIGSYIRANETRPTVQDYESRTFVIHKQDGAR